MREVYKHYKGGMYYVTCIAVHTETGEHIVIYEDDYGHVWARPFQMFYGMVDVDGEIVERFTRVISK